MGAVGKCTIAFSVEVLPPFDPDPHFLVGVIRCGQAHDENDDPNENWYFRGHFEQLLVKRMDHVFANSLRSNESASTVMGRMMGILVT